MGEESPGKVCGIVKVKQELVGAKKTYKKVKKYFCFQLNIRNYLCFEPDPDHPCEERLGEFPPLLPSSPSHVPSCPYVHLVLVLVCAPGSDWYFFFIAQLSLSQYLSRCMLFQDSSNCDSKIELVTGDTTCPA